MYIEMKLTKNEKLTLKLLIDNGRISDAEIARKLNITTQAVGKIRRKLESVGLIRGYSTIVDYGKLGVHTFAVALLKFTLKSWEDLGELGIEKNVLDSPHIINAYRVPEGNATHIVLYGFRDLKELDEYFSSLKTKPPFNQYIETQKLYVFSKDSLIKNNPAQLLHKVIDNLGKETKNNHIHFREIENFKKRLEK